MQSSWFLVPVNPERWTVPPMTPGRVGKKLIVKAGRNTMNDNYKQAVRESVISQGGELLAGEVFHLHLMFSRKLEQYLTENKRKMTRRRVDATNMQKLTEDALQGVLYENDVNNVFVSSQVIEQEKTTVPFIVIMCSGFAKSPYLWIPPEFSDNAAQIHLAMEKRRREGDAEQPMGDNDWPPRV